MQRSPSVFAGMGSDIVIFVTGSTGAGKTTFVNNVLQDVSQAGGTRFEVHEGLDACTTTTRAIRLSPSKLEYPSALARVVLVDGRGFEGGQLGQHEDVLAAAQAWFEEAYQSTRAPLDCGVMHVQDVTQPINPLQLQASINLSALSRGNVFLILTTKWEAQNNDEVNTTRKRMAGDTSWRRFTRAGFEVREIGKTGQGCLSAVKRFLYRSHEQREAGRQSIQKQSLVKHDWTTQGKLLWEGRINSKSRPWREVFDTAGYYFAQYQASNSPAELKEAISLYHEALAFLPPGSADCLAVLHSLAISLAAHSEHSEAAEDLDEAITLYRQALDLRPKNHPDRFSSLRALAVALSRRSQKHESGDDLQESISSCREALEVAQERHSGQAMLCFIELANAINHRYSSQVKVAGDLEEVISSLRAALEFRPFCLLSRISPLKALAVALFERFREIGLAKDLGECISLLKEAMGLHSPGHADRGQYLTNSSVSHHSLCGELNDNGKVEDTTWSLRELLTLLPSNHPSRPPALSMLADAIYARPQGSWSAGDLEEVATLRREAVALCPPGHRDREAHLIKLSRTIFSRHFTRFKAVGDLEEMTSLFRELLAMHPSDHPDHPSFIHALAGPLLLTPRGPNLVSSLDEAIPLLRKAATLCPPGDPCRGQELANVAHALCRRFDATLGSADGAECLEEAVSLLREALTLWPPSHRCRYPSLKALADTLFWRLQPSGPTDCESFKLETTLRREAAALCSPGNPHREIYLTDLAHTLYWHPNSESGSSSAHSNLDEVVTLHREALTLMPSTHILRPSSMHALADALCRSAQPAGSFDAQEEVASLRKEALVHPDCDPCRDNLAHDHGKRPRPPVISEFTFSEQWTLTLTSPPSEF